MTLRGNGGRQGEWLKHGNKTVPEIRRYFEFSPEFQCMTPFLESMERRGDTVQ